MSKNEKVLDIFGPAFFIWAVDDDHPDAVFLVAITKHKELLLDALDKTSPEDTITVVEVPTMLEILEWP